MEWLNTVNIIVAIIASISAISGVTLLRIVKLLRKEPSTITSQPPSPKPYVPPKPIHLYDLTPILRQGLVDTANYFLKDVRFFSSWRDEMSGDTPSSPVGFCLLLFGTLVFGGGIVLMCPLSIVISSLYHQAPPYSIGDDLDYVLNILYIGGVIGAAIACIPLFIWFSIIYYEKVGPLIEKLKSEYHQELVNQQEGNQ